MSEIRGSHESDIRVEAAITSSPVVALTLAALAAVIAVVRLRFLRDLPDWDLATYSLVGDALAHGRHLYTDIWDMKPPGVFAAYAIGNWIARGDWRVAAYFVATVASIGTMLALYVAGAGAFSRKAGLWSAALWTCICAQPALGAYYANTEAFINLFIASAIALLLRPIVEQASPSRSSRDFRLPSRRCSNKSRSHPSSRWQLQP